MDARGGDGAFGGARGGIGVQALGGNSNNGGGGIGLYAQGGFSNSGGGGLEAFGGGTSVGRGGRAVRAVGGDSGGFGGGDGIQSMGGKSHDNIGGFGVDASGGDSFGGTGGTGVRARAGNSTNGAGGSGAEAIGGDSDHGTGGNAVIATGGNSDGTGGNGVVAAGGHFNGRGVVATGGIGPVGYGVEATGGASTGSGSTAGAGVFAKGGPSSGANSESGFGIIAIPGEPTDGAARGTAGSFEGDVSIGGHLTVFGDLDVSGSKHFKIDHPLDPENKYLLHASVESSEVLNVYSGNVTTDAKGEAVVSLADWFEALNRDLRYQLTVIGTFAQAIVANEVQNNRFTIKTNAPNVKVSWQVTGVRSDKAMKKTPFKAEADKPERERGHYLQPELYDQPEERSVEWARHPELMKQLKQQRLEAQQAEEQRKQIGRLVPSHPVELVEFK